MPIDRVPAALKFFDSVVEKHGYKPDDVASVLAVFNGLTCMEDVSLRVKAKINDGPYTALGIFAVDMDPSHRPERHFGVDANGHYGPIRMTNELEQAPRRYGVAVDYMRSLSLKLCHDLTLPHGHVGDRKGYAHMGGDYFVAESGLVLPCGGVIDLTVTIPFSETARSRRAAAV